MIDLISREKVFDVVSDWNDNESDIETLAFLISNIPIEEPERCEDCVNFSKTRLLIPQPERKKGKWERIGHTRHRCSECKGVALLDDFGRECLTDFCSCCGAEMSIGTFSEK